MEAPTRRDYAWATFSIAMLVLFLGGVIGAIWQAVVDGEWVALLPVPVAVLWYWWWGMGAWRRTVWGRRTLRPRPRTPRT